MTRYIYALHDPRTGAIRYVGVSKNVEDRLYKHTHNHLQRTTHTANWLRSLLTEDLLPQLTILETCEGNDWIVAEQQWIADLRKQGCDLTNATAGGDGVRELIWTVEQRQNLSVIMRGKPKSLQMRERLSATKRGSAPLAAIRARSEKAARGELRQSDETRAKVSAAVLARPNATCPICGKVCGHSGALGAHQFYKHGGSDAAHR